MAGMGSSGTGTTGGGPKILLAKPTTPRSEGGSGVGVGGVVKLMKDRDEENAARVRLSHGSLNLLSDSWDFHSDRLLPLMSDNTDFMVVGVLGPPGAGKSTIMNELYGFDGTNTGVIQPFPTQSEELKAAAKHCSTGIELRISAERIILLDCQPVFSASVLMELMRSDVFSNVSMSGGDTLSAELAHELMGLQVEMLKQGIPDPSSLPSATPGQSSAPEKDDIDAVVDELPEYFSDVVFVHTKLREQEFSLPEIRKLEKSLSLFFPSPAFRKNTIVKYRPPQFPAMRSYFGNGHLLEKERGAPRGANGVISLSGRPPTPSKLQAGAFPVVKEQEEKRSKAVNDDKQDTAINVFVLPLKVPDEMTRHYHESYTTMLAKLRNQILSVPRRPFAKTLTEREWLRNAGRMWDLVKRSQVLAEYIKILQSSGLYRR